MSPEREVVIVPERDYHGMKLRFLHNGQLAAVNVRSAFGEHTEFLGRKDAATLIAELQAWLNTPPPVQAPIDRSKECSF